MLAEGKRTLNAKQALYYVRVRYLYDEHGNHVESSGDYFRKVNQLNLLMEISKQIITPDNILNANSILNSLTSNVKHSIAFSDLSEYLKIAQEFLGDTYSIEPYLLTGDAIDPFHDDASYVDIAFVGEEKINALVRRWQALARSSGVL